MRLVKYSSQILISRNRDYKTEWLKVLLEELDSCFVTKKLSPDTKFDRSFWPMLT